VSNDTESQARESLVQLADEYLDRYRVSDSWRLVSALRDEVVRMADSVPVEPGWEYGEAYDTGAGEVIANSGVRISTDEPYRKVKRFKAVEAGPWLPVEPVQVDEDTFSTGKHQRLNHSGSFVCDTCINVLNINIRWDQAPCRKPDFVQVDTQSNLSIRKEQKK